MAFIGKKEESKFKEKANSSVIERCLVFCKDSPFHISDNHFVIPRVSNLLPTGEADLISISKNMFISECEIKVSLSDLKRDFKKYKFFKYFIQKREKLIKKFYYAVPEDISEKAIEILNNCEIEMVKDAGIIICKRDYAGFFNDIAIHKESKIYKADKIEVKDLMKMCKNSLWRYWNSTRDYSRLYSDYYAAASRIEELEGKYER